MLTDKIEAISRAPWGSLDVLARSVWTDHAAGRLADTEAQTLAEAIEARRRALRRPAQAHSPLRVVVREGEERPPVANVAGSRAPARAPARGPRQLVLRIPRPATYDRRKSIERRRGIAASGMMPGPLARGFTTGEQSALAVIASEVMERGTCSLCLDAIAARSGTSRSTVKRAIKQARVLGLIHVNERPRPGQKHLPSVIRIMSAAWLGWLKHRTRHRIGVQSWTATDTEGFTKGLRGSVGAVSAKATRQPHDRRGSRGHRQGAL
jgi:hypothetical protein